MVRILTFAGCAYAGFDIVQTLWTFVLTSCAFQAFAYSVAGIAVVRYDNALKAQAVSGDAGQ